MTQDGVHGKACVDGPWHTLRSSRVQNKRAYNCVNLIAFALS